MKKSINISNEDYALKNQILSSLVLNPPYKIDGFNSAPKISKIFSFPFGIKIASYLLCKLIYNCVISMSLIMAAASTCIFFFYLPVQNQNVHLLNNIKSLTNQKLTLLDNLQESTNYNKLFFKANVFSLEDSKKVIYLKADLKHSSKESLSTIFTNKYPSIKFTGF